MAGGENDDTKIVFGADASEVADAAAEASSSVQDFGQTVNDVSGQMDMFGDTATSMGEQTQAAAGSADDAIKDFGMGFGEVIGELNEKLEGFSSMIRTVAGLGGVGLLADALVGVGEKALNFIEGTDQSAAHLGRFAQAVGLPIEKLSELELEMQRFGISGGAVESIVNRLSRTMQTAQANANSLQSRAFAALGIGMTDLKARGNDVIGMLELMADRYQAAADGPAKLGLQMTLLRMGGSDLVAFLDQGSAKIKQDMDDIGASGLAMTSAQQKALKDQDDQLTKLTQSWDAMKRKVVLDVGPAIIATLNGITTLIDVAANHANALPGRVAGRAILGVSQAVTGVQEQIADLTAELDKLEATGGRVASARGGMIVNPNWATQVDALKVKIQGLVEELYHLQVGIGNISGGDVRMDAALPAVGSLPAPTTDKSAEYMAKLQSQLLQQEQMFDGYYNDVESTDVQFWQDIKDTATLTLKEKEEVEKALWTAQKAFYKQDLSEYLDSIQQQEAAAGGDVAKKIAIQQGLIAHLNAIDASHSAEMRQAVDQLTQLQLQQANEQEHIAMTSANSKLGIEQKQVDDEKARLEIAVSANQVSNDKKFASLVELENKSYAIQSQILANDLALTGQSAQYYQDLQDKRAELEASHAITLMQIDRQAATADAQVWKDGFNEISQALDTMVDGVLQGTQTMSQAIGRSIGNILLVWAKDLATMLLQFIAFEAATLLHWNQIAAAISNPLTGGGFGGVIGAVLGVGGKGGGGGGTDPVTGQLISAITGQTAATTANTGGIVNWIGQQLESLAQFLGLTTASTAQTVATTADTTTTVTLIPAIAALTVAVSANTAALAASSAASSVGGDLGDVASIIPFLASGASNIINPGLAFLHPGEMVLPEGVASVMRRGLPTAGINGAGGNMANVTFVVQAMDSQDVMRFFNKHGRAIAKTVAGQFKDNPSTRPDF